MSYHYDSPYTYHYQTNDPTLVMIIMALYFLIILLSLASTALIMVSRWHIFKKMGMPGWKGIIPYYGDYMLFKTVWSTKAFWAMIIGTAVYFVLYMMSAFMLPVFSVLAARNSPGSTQVMAVAVWGILAAVLVIAFLVFILVIQIRLNIRLAKAFGKGAGFGLGLAFLSMIFYPVLAFGKAQYVGNQTPYGQNPYQQPAYQNPYQQLPYGQNQGYQNPYRQPNQFNYQNNPNPYGAPDYQNNQSNPDPYNSAGDTEVLNAPDPYGTPGYQNNQGYPDPYHSTGDTEVLNVPNPYDNQNNQYPNQYNDPNNPYA